MKYIIDIPDKEINKFVLGDKLIVPVTIGATKYSSIGFDTGIKVTPIPYDTEIGRARKQGELRECPFCGGEAKINVEYGDYGRTPHIYYVKCKHCGAKIERVSNSYFGYDLSDSVANAWNRRVKDEQT